MKTEFIRQVKRNLPVPRRVKREILRDLEEIFASAAEHGESEQQVIARLGSPAAFAADTAAQFGIDCTATRRRRAWLGIGAVAAMAAAAFTLCAVAKAQRLLAGVIGQADGMTQIRLESWPAVDPLLLLAAIGTAAAAAAIVLAIRMARKGRG